MPPAGRVATSSPTQTRARPAMTAIVSSALSVWRGGGGAGGGPARGVAGQAVSGVDLELRAAGRRRTAAGAVPAHRSPARAAVSLEPGVAEVVSSGRRKEE